MKAYLTTILIAAMLLICSCKKESRENTPLTGRWKLVETLADPGDGSGKWTPVPHNSNDYVEFKANGALSSSLYTDYNRYVVKDSVTVTFFKQDNTLQNYRYGINKEVLTMSPAGPIYCIEGCGVRFVKTL